MDLKKQSIHKINRVGGCGLCEPHVLYFYPRAGVSFFVTMTDPFSRHS